ncbi:hypothetical protein ACIQTT_08025 [Microbacterium sp. NPDC090225]|uniref:hypothetical protein n=1 Tax=Microbacterium sp. NPDC090225 TaxID=3364207 RepID=UPI0038207EAC
MSLREELLGLAPAVPRFRILLPPEWASFPVTPELGGQFEQKAREVFARAGRPDLDGVFSAQLARAMRGLQEAGAKYVFLPSERTPGKDPFALSMVATYIDSPDGPLDGWITARVRAGAEMLDPEGRIVFWRDRGPGLDGETHKSQSTYVIAVPGSNRRKALMLTGSTIVGAETDDDDEYAVAVRMIFDAMAATVTWIADDAEGAV